jgi:hypothetical protein
LISEYGNCTRYIFTYTVAAVNNPPVVIDSGSNADAETTLNTTVNAVNGTAAVTLSTDDLDDALKDAGKNGSDAIVIAPKIIGTAKKVTVELPKASLIAVTSESDASLTVDTPVGNMTISNDAVTSIASQAAGSTVTMSLELVETSSLTVVQQVAVGNNPVFNISILSGGSHISNLDSGSITIALPYTLKNGETGENVTVWYLNDLGRLQQMACRYDKTTCLATFTTNHLSNYLVSYDAWMNPFVDIKTTDWFYNAVKYVSQNTLMCGSSTTAFEPNTDMTRAMLVSTLYRLESKPIVTGPNTFTDVKSGEWYTDAVIWASANHIVGGYGSGLFGTNDSVTREQMATILYNYAKYKGYGITVSADLSIYTDASEISGWALSAMKWANAKDLVTGRTTTSIAPSVSASRAEVAETLLRFVSTISA